MPAMPNCIQMQLIATHVFPPFWLYIADLQRPKTTSEQSVPTLAWSGLYVANLQHAKPTKAMPAIIQMQLIAAHVFPPFWLYIADLQRPKTTSEQSVHTALACMLPTYSMPNQLKPCRPCPTASKCN